MRATLSPMSFRRLGLAAACVLPFFALAGACSKKDSDSPPAQPDTDATADGASNEGGPGDSGGDTGPGPGELANYTDYAINHILSTGQSNSVGNGGVPVLTTAAGPYTNLMFDTGVMSMTGCDDGVGCTALQTPTSMVPILEGDTFFYAVETPSSAIANQISKIATETYQFGTKAGTPSKHDVFVSLDGRSGNTYWCLRKGSCSYHDGNVPPYQKPFEQGMTEVAAAKAMADAKGLSYAVRAVTVVHGEADSDGYITTPGHVDEFPLPGTDGVSTITNYTDAMAEWQRDYEQGVTAITGQKTPVPLLIAQLSGWKLATTSVIPQMQLDAHTTKAPGKVIVVTPTYMFTVASDCLHYDAPSLRTLGEYFAKAYARMVFQGLPWEPLRPLSITHAGNVITVKYLVPKPPLVIDTTAVTQAPNYGYDVLDAGGNVLAVSKVELSGTDSVNITLADAPTGALTLRYAQNQANPNPDVDAAAPADPSATCIGPGTQAGYAPGPRGNIHDSDDTVSQFGYNLANWSVSFTEPVN